VIAVRFNFFGEGSNAVPAKALAAPERIPSCHKGEAPLDYHFYRISRTLNP